MRRWPTTSASPFRARDGPRRRSGATASPSSSIPGAGTCTAIWRTCSPLPGIAGTGRTRSSPCSSGGSPGSGPRPGRACRCGRPSSRGAWGGPRRHGSGCCRSRRETTATRREKFASSSTASLTTSAPARWRTGPSPRRLRHRSLHSRKRSESWPPRTRAALSPPPTRSARRSRPGARRTGCARAPWKRRGGWTRKPATSASSPNSPPRTPGRGAGWAGS